MKFRATLILIAFFAISGMPLFVHAQTLTASQRAALEQQLAQVEADQKQAAADLANAQAKSSSLANTIAVLAAKIKAEQLDIKAKNLTIQTLGQDIVEKQGHISDLEGQIAQGKETLAQLMRTTDQIGAYSLPEVLLSQTSISGFFTDIDTFQSLQQGLKTTFEMIRSDEASTTAEKDALDKRRNAEIDARYAIQQVQAQVQKDQAQQSQLLSISKGNEKSYSTLVAQKAAQAAHIRAALFVLAGANPIPFGQALQYAQAASKQTGVDPAFLLAILTQESNLGANVGTCYLTDQSSGAGVSARSGSPVSKVMSPTRDVPPFLSIVKSLGLDYKTTVVSCPQSYGWGGAMGPAQFIASTWMLIKDRVATLLGISGMPNPWDPKQAFMAAGLYLADRGAGGGGYTAELNAACKYYSGSSCNSISRPYGTSVMALANKIQTTQINVLQGI